MSHPFACGFILTASGRRVDPLNLKPADVCVEDVAHSLSMQCRFRGHTRSFYSVAEHSVRVSLLVPAPARKEALLHDAAEAYLVDWPRPVKYRDEMEWYRDAEDKALGVIYRKLLGYDAPRFAAIVKHADRVMLAAEMRDLMPVVTPDASDGGFLEAANAYVQPIAPCAQPHAREWLMSEFKS